jgi:hypothetical protein
VLPGGEEVFQASYESSDMLTEAFEEALDSALNTTVLTNGHFGWHEGMLFLYGPEFDHDAVYG